MEDAHIAIAPFTNKNLGLFAVFDGHGGNKIYIQDPKQLFSFRSILANSYKKMKTLKMVIIRKL